MRKHLKRISDVFARSKNVLSLRNKPSVSSIEQEPQSSQDVWATYGRHIMAGVVVLLIVLIIIGLTQSRANVATFYSDKCLGGWTKPYLAQGEPDVVDGSGTYTEGNSAVLKESISQIFCADFNGEIPEDTDPKKYTLKFSWNIIDGTRSQDESGNESEEESSETPATTTITVHPDSLASTTDAILNIPEGATSEATIILPEESEEENETPAEPVAEQSVDENVEVDEPESVEVAEETSEPESPVTDLTETVASAISAIQSIASALLSVEDGDGVPTINTEEMLEVLYTLDGSTWESLGRITNDNWEDATFEISAEKMALWNDISNLQISVQALPTISKDAVVYLDSMWLEVEYGDTDVNDELSEEELADVNKFPRVLIGNDGLNKDAFGADEDALFEFEIEDAITTSAGTTTQSTSTSTSALPETSATAPETVQPSPEEATSTATTTAFFFRKNSILDLIPTAFAQEESSEEGIDAQILTAVITDSEDHQLAVKPTAKIIDKKLRVSVPKPGNTFRPGKYRIEIEVAANQKVYVFAQDFTWGVLAINLNKSLYLPHEQAYVQMAALTDAGNTICDARLKVDITTPTGTVQNFTTENRTISYGVDCGNNNVTDKPDYFFYYQPSEIGTYSLKLTNIENEYSIDTVFTVAHEVPFEVERVGATRINPSKAAYTMTFAIKANEDFSGTIVERVPAIFVISQNDAFATETEGDETIISWEQDIKQGETVTLSYTYEAPLVSPQFYLLGSLQFYDQNALERIINSVGDDIVFEEVRQWQIASDAVTSYTLPGSTASNTCTAPSGGSVSDDSPPTTVGTHLFQCDSDSNPNVEENVVFTGFNFGLPAAATITGIVVHINDVSVAASGTGVQPLKVRLSYDGGSNWTAAAQNDADTCTTGDISNTSADGVEYYCSDATSTAAGSDPSSGTLWGRPSWTVTQLNNVNFQVQVTADNDNTTARIQRFDLVKVKVYYTVPHVISSAANQSFEMGQAPAAISTITVTSGDTVFTTANDIRIGIATTTGANMLWDTSDTSATIGGTASGKVSSTVSYEGGGSVLVLNVTSDFAEGETVTVAGLSYANFSGISSSVNGIVLYAGGYSDTSADDTDDKTISISGATTLANHADGQVIDKFQNDETSTTTEFFGFNVTNGEQASTTLSFTLSSIDGIVNSNITDPGILLDVDSDGLVTDAGSWTTLFDTSETEILSYTVDTDNQVLYAGTGNSGLIMRCAQSTGCDSSGDWTTAYDTSETDIHVLYFDASNDVIFAGTGGSGLILRCVVASGCDASGDWATSYDSPASNVYAIGRYSANFLFGTDNSGIVYTCTTSSSCDASGDFSTQYDSASAEIRSIIVVGTQIFAGSGTDGVIYRCFITCTSSGNWGAALDSSESYIYTIGYDSVNAIFYAGTGAGGIIYRCASTCVTGSNWRVAYDTAESEIRSLTFDSRSRTMYAGSASSGLVLSCPTSTGCDESTDWSTSVDTSAATIHALAFDSVNNAMYAGSATGGVMYRKFLGDYQIISKNKATWTTSYDTSASTIEGSTYDPANSVLYAGGTTIFRCATSTNCDASGDWSNSYASLPGGAAVKAMLFDASNNVIYAAVSATGIIYRCATSTSCDADGDWTTSYDSTETDMISLGMDTTNGVIYAGSNSGGIIYRCPVSSGCDAQGDWAVSWDTAQTSIPSFTFDSDNGVLYAGTNGNGILYRCLVSTSCDAQGDWTTSYDFAPTGIWSLAFDPVNDVIYTGSDSGGIIRRCFTSTSCDAATDWATSTDTAATTIESLMYDSTNNLLYAGGDSTGFVYRCDPDADCAVTADWHTSYDSAETVIYSLVVDDQGIVYAGSGSGGIIYRGDITSRNISGTSGTLAFLGTSTLPVASRDYLLRTTFSNLDEGDEITFALTSGNVIPYGVYSLGKLPVSGSASSIEHIWEVSQSLTFTVDSNSAGFGNVTPSVVSKANNTLTVETGDSSGFNVTVVRDDPDTTMDLTTDATINIPDKTAWAPGADCVTAGNATASTTEAQTLQFRVAQAGTDASNYCSAWWGTDDTTANARFAGFPSAAKEIINRASASSPSTNSIVLYNLIVPSSQYTGSYSGSITYTATANP